MAPGRARCTAWCTVSTDGLSHCIAVGHVDGELVTTCATGQAVDPGVVQDPVMTGVAPGQDGRCGWRASPSAATPSPRNGTCSRGPSVGRCWAPRPGAARSYSTFGLVPSRSMATTWRARAGSLTSSRNATPSWWTRRASRTESPGADGHPSISRIVGATSINRHESSTSPTCPIPGAGNDERGSGLDDSEGAVLTEVPTLVAPVVSGGMQHHEVWGARGGRRAVPGGRRRGGRSCRRAPGAEPTAPLRGCRNMRDPGVRRGSGR